ncbi:hypothetical protein HOLleu_12492 [Holothuria leucospilota]|uniref:Uncharacterized protein n=1 Tax=Holothuria leucospilota TaxID=206669 RepID=A0A9Q1HA56_HOLLE|nr:hypothetical protein HOLleu_12492 [Holothuria leucospilota]
MDVENDAEKIKFSYLLDTFGLEQHVTQATHRSGHILDLLISKQGDRDLRIENTQTTGEISDHQVVRANLTLMKPKILRSNIWVHSTKTMDTNAFRDDMMEWVNTLVPRELSTEQLAECYNSGLTEIFNRHAPLKKTKITSRPRPEWINDELLALKRRVRQAERKSKVTQNEEHILAWKQMKIDYRKTLRFTKSNYVNDKIASCGNDSKQLFITVNELLGRGKPNPLPDHNNDGELAELFNDFFISKIQRIRDSMDGEELFIPSVHSSSSFTDLESCSEKAVHKIISNMKSTTCGSDPLPTKYVKNNIDILLPLITKIVNLSLSRGEFSSLWKTSIIIPLLKKSTLDHEIKNYRPVNNLPWISKVVEPLITFRKCLLNRIVIITAYGHMTNKGFRYLQLK